MKTIHRFKVLIMVAMSVAILSCATRTGSATDTTGTNGATNGNGKVPRGNVHQVNN